MRIKRSYENELPQANCLLDKKLKNASGWNYKNDT